MPQPGPNGSFVHGMHRTHISHVNVKRMPLSATWPSSSSPRLDLVSSLVSCRVAGTHGVARSFMKLPRWVSILPARFSRQPDPAFPGLFEETTSEPWNENQSVFGSNYPILHSPNPSYRASRLSGIYNTACRNSIGLNETVYTNLFGGPLKTHQTPSPTQLHPQALGHDRCGQANAENAGGEGSPPASNP